MPAEVESMMYVGEVPWHGLGTYVGDNPVTSEEAIISAGLDWEVELQELRTAEDEILVPSHKAVVRTSDASVLGVVGNRYKPFQNKEIFTFLDDLVKDGSLRYHTAGSLRNGRKVWMLGKVGNAEIVPQDAIDKYLFCWTSHDGSGSTHVAFVSIRVVCMNTARVALTEASDAGIKIRHTGELQKKVESAREVLGFALDEFMSYENALKTLAEFKMSDSLAEQYVNLLFPDSPEEDKETSAHTIQMRDYILDLMTNGIGQKIPGVENTAYGAYNAVTEFITHHRMVRGSNPMERRFEASLLGAGNDLVQNAFGILRNMAGAQ